MATKRQKTRAQVQAFHETEAANEIEANKEAEGAEDRETPTNDGSPTVQLDDFDFEADEEDTEELRALVASPTDGPVIVSVYYQRKSGRRQPIGFGMFNTKNIRQEILRFEASADAHFAPFYINQDILANRKVVLINQLFTALQAKHCRAHERDMLLCAGRTLAGNLANSSLVSCALQDDHHDGAAAPSDGTLY